MGTIKSFFDLRTWKQSHELTLEIYRQTARFPKEELYGLTSQLRRAAVSIPSNIAEGMGRHGTKDLIRFLIQARGSIQEVIYQLYLSKELGYILPDECEQLIAKYDGVGMGLNAHIAKLIPSQTNH